METSRLWLAVRVLVTLVGVTQSSASVNNANLRAVVSPAVTRFETGQDWIQLNCSISGGAEPASVVYAWKRLDGRVLPKGRHERGGRTGGNYLIIRQPIAADEGVYMCLVTMGNGSPALNGSGIVFYSSCMEKWMSILGIETSKAQFALNSWRRRGLTADDLTKSKEIHLSDYLGSNSTTNHAFRTCLMEYQSRESGQTQFCRRLELKTPCSGRGTCDFNATIGDYRCKCVEPLHGEWCTEGVNCPVPREGFVNGATVISYRDITQRFLTVKYFCDEGYHFHGARIRQCDHGVWTPADVPQCRKPGDPPIPRKITLSSSTRPTTAPTAPSIIPTAAPFPPLTKTPEAVRPEFRQVSDGLLNFSHSVSESVQAFSPALANLLEAAVVLTTEETTTPDQKKQLAQRAVAATSAYLVGYGGARMSEEDPYMAARIVQSLEDLSRSVPINENSSFTVLEPDLAIAVACHPRHSTDSVVTLRVGQNQSLELSMTADHDIPDDGGRQLVVRVPVKEAKGVPATAGCQQLVSFVIYWDDTLFAAVNRCDSPAYSVETPIVGATVGNETTTDMSGNPIVLDFKTNLTSFTIPSGYKLQCSYWDVRLSSWASDGCAARSHSAEGHVTCACDHLTHFAVLLVQVPGNTRHDFVLEVVTYLCCGVSVVCLLLTIFIVMSTKKLRRTPFQQLLVFLSISLIALILLLTTAELSVAFPLWCKIHALLLHFVLLNTFGLMCVAAMHLHDGLVKVKRNVQNRRWIAAPVIALVIIVITAGVTRLAAHGSEKICWITDMPVFYSSVGGPLLLMLLINCTLFLSIFYHLKFKRQKCRGQLKSPDRVNLTQITVSLTFLLGVTWLAGGLLLVSQHVALQYVFVVLNGSQGTAVFLCFMLRSGEVQRQLIAWRSTISSRSSSARSSLVSASDLPAAGSTSQASTVQTVSTKI